MAVALSGNIDYNGSQPNFSRDIFNTIEEMRTVSKQRMPKMFVASCLETGKLYLYNKSNEEDPTLGLWREATLDDYEKLSNKPSIPTKISELEDDSNFAKTDDVYTKEEVDEKLANVDLTEYAKSADVYTKEEVDTSLADYAKSADVYTKTEINEKLASSDVDLTEYAKSADVYTKTEIDKKLANADVNIDLTDYAKAADVYTKEETDGLFAEAETTYTKEEANTIFAKLADVYTKAEVDERATLTLTNPTTIEVGNIAVGTTFNKATLQEVMTLMLYGATKTPAPKVSGSSTVNYASNSISIPLETSAYFTTRLADSSLITTNAGTIKSVSLSGNKLVVAFEALTTCTISIGAGALENTSTNEKIYTGSTTNNKTTVSTTVQTYTLPTPTISAVYTNSSRQIAISISASYNGNYATLSTLSSSAISGVDGTLTGSGNSYIFTLADSVIDGDYTLQIADGAVKLTAKSSYYTNSETQSAEYSLPFTVATVDKDQYEWSVPFTMVNTDGSEYSVEKIDEDVAASSEDDVYNDFDNAKYELYFLGTEVHPCEVLVPAADTVQKIGTIPEGNSNMIKANAYWDLRLGAPRQIVLYNFVLTIGNYNFVLKKLK